MKKAILLLVTVSITLTTMAAGETYYQKMGETLAAFSTSETLE